MSIRVLGGQFKGSVLSVPDSARPTLIRSRQSLFDILASQAGAISDSKNSQTLTDSTANPRDFFKNKVILDCFAGSGALGIESLSRGAVFSYFIDASQNAINAIYENIKKLNLEQRSRIIKTDILKIRKFNGSTLCDIVFIDPPYGKVSIKKTLNRLLKTGWIDENSLIITEEDISKTENLSDTTRIFIEKKLGKSVFRIMKLLREKPDAELPPHTQEITKPDQIGL